MDSSDFRKEYTLNTLTRSHLKKDPFDQLMVWMRGAIAQRVIEFNAAVLATANKEGRPSSRTVLIKEFERNGLIFYTNYQSRKGHDLAENPYASLTFYWKELEQQVTVDGFVEKISKEQSERYFAKRPRESQLEAWCSRQGVPISSRSILMEEYNHFEQKFAGKEVSKPSFWGGYRLIPQCYLFWQGRENRLHDRFKYIKEDCIWTAVRLSP